MLAEVSGVLTVASEQVFGGGSNVHGIS